MLSVTGSNASFNHTVHTLYVHMTQQLTKKNQVELLEIDGVANVLEEKVTLKLFILQTTLVQTKAITGSAHCSDKVHVCGFHGDLSWKKET